MADFYCKNDINYRLKHLNGPLYKDTMVNYHSHLRDATDVPVIDYISNQILLGKVDLTPVTESSSLVKDFKGSLLRSDVLKRSKNSNRAEPLLCDYLYKTKADLGPLGQIVGREINLIKGRHTNIDLLSFESKTKTLFLIECKAALIPGEKIENAENFRPVPCQSNETALRSALEIEFYYCLLLKENTFVDQFIELKGKELNLNPQDRDQIQIKKALLYPTGSPYIYSIIENPEYSELNHLINKLEIVCQGFSVDDKNRFVLVK